MLVLFVVDSLCITGSTRESLRTLTRPKISTFLDQNLYVVNSMWIVHCREHKRILGDLDKAQVDVVLLFMLFILFVLF